MCLLQTRKDCRSDSMDIIQNNMNMSDYYRPSANINVDKEASRLIIQKITANLAMYLQELAALRAHSI